MSAAAAKPRTSYPYPGLPPYEKEDADFFFGRKTHVTDLLQRLAKHRFLAVVGPSGCGKSSLVRAGLLPALEGGFLPTDRIGWCMAVFRPGNQPLREFANALLKCGIFGDIGQDEASRRDDLLHDLQRGPRSLAGLLELNAHAQDANLLILVDQFEELFRLEQQGGEEESRSFVNLLLETAKAPGIAAHVVITMRTDFLGKCPVYFGLPEALNEGQYLTPRLTREQMRLAIEGPARMFGADVDPAVVNRLLNDMGTDPDQLPLMQHLLMRMWRKSDLRAKGLDPNLEKTTSRSLGSGVVSPLRLTQDDYQSEGPFAAALEKHIETVYLRRLKTPAQRALAERLFRFLTDVTEDGRMVRRTPVPTFVELYRTFSVSPDELRPVIDAFREDGRSFLMPPKRDPLEVGTSVDITHESVIRQWKRLRAWTEDEANLRRMRSDLTDAAKDWITGGRADVDAVLQGSQRIAATHLRAKCAGELEPVLTEFLSACDRRQWRESLFKRWGAIATAVVVILAVGLAIVSLRNYETGKFTSHLHRQFVSRIQGDVAQSWKEGDLSAALLWSALAWKYATDEKLSSSADQRLYQLQAGVALAGLAKPVSSIADKDCAVAKLSPDGKTLVTVSKDWGVTLRSYDEDAGFGGSITLRAGHVSETRVNPQQVVWSPNSQFVAVAEDWNVAPGQITVWDTNNVGGATEPPSPGRSLKFQPPRPRELEQQPLQIGFAAAPANPSGSDPLEALWLIVLLAKPNEESGHLYAWDFSDNSSQVLDHGPGESSLVAGFHVVRQSRLIVGLGMKTTELPIFDLGAKKTEGRYRPAKHPSIEDGTLREGSLKLADSDDSGRWLVTVGKIRDIDALTLWYRKDATFEHVRCWHPDQVNTNRVAFDPAGKFFVTAGESDKKALVWDTQATKESKTLSPYPKFALPHSQEIDLVSICRNPRENEPPFEQRIVTATRDRVVWVWDGGKGHLVLPPLHLITRLGDIGFTAGVRQLMVKAGMPGSVEITMWSLSSSQPDPQVLDGTVEASVENAGGGQFAATITGKSGVSIWDQGGLLKAPTLSLSAIPMLTGKFELVRFSSDQKRILAIRSKGKGSTAEVWENSSDGWRRDSSKSFSPGVKPEDGALSNDSSHAVVVGKNAGDQRMVEIWRLAKSPERVMEFVFNVEQVNHVLFSPDYRNVVVCGGKPGMSGELSDGVALLFPLESKDPAAPKELRHRQDYINRDKDDGTAIFSATFTPDSRLLMTAGEDNTVFVWKTDTGERITVLRGHVMDARHVTVSPDGKWLATCGVDFNVFVWDLKEIQNLPRGHDDLKSPKPKFILTHDGRANRVVFDENSQLLACVGQYGTVNLWDVPSGVLVARWVQEGNVKSAWFGSNPLRLVTTAVVRSRAASTQTKYPGGKSDEPQDRFQVRTWLLPQLQLPVSDVLVLAKLLAARSRPSTSAEDKHADDWQALRPMEPRIFSDLWEWDKKRDDRKSWDSVLNPAH